MDEGRSTNPAIRVHGRRAFRPSRSPLAAALLALTLLCCFLGLVGSAGASQSFYSPQALLARLALQRALLTPSDGAAGDQFGYSVARSGDTALVGAPFHDTGGVSDAGAAYVFTRSDGIWTQQQKLMTGESAANDLLGRSVALSGETALVGAPGKVLSGVGNAGAAYVFTRSATSWTEQARLTEEDTDLLHWFGWSVALSGDTALVGAPNHTGYLGGGAAFVFVRTGGSWARQAKLVNDYSLGRQEGYSVALSGDTALVGDPDKVAGWSGAGTAYAYTRTGGTWTQQSTFFPAVLHAYDEFGFSLALSGETSLVAAPFHDTEAGLDAGAVYRYTRSKGLFRLDNQPIVFGGSGEQFGWSLTLSGAEALVGARFHVTADKGATGGAYVILLQPTVTLFAPLKGAVGSRVTLTGSGFSDATSVTFNGVSALFTATSDMQLTTTVPPGATTGVIGVSTPAGTGTSVTSFAVTARITGLDPSAGKRDAIVTITGKTFGKLRGTSFVAFGVKRCTKYVYWSNTRIKVRVPAKAAFGYLKVKVRTSAGTSNGKTFRVRR